MNIRGVCFLLIMRIMHYESSCLYGFSQNKIEGGWGAGNGTEGAARHGGRTVNYVCSRGCQSYGETKQAIGTTLVLHVDTYKERL